MVVLLHGFPLNRSMWKFQKATLGATYRVIAPDLRGHGETAAPDGPYPIDAMADDVIELLDALQLREPVVLGGLSMGGYVALPRPRRLRYPEPVPIAPSDGHPRHRRHPRGRPDPAWPWPTRWTPSRKTDDVVAGMLPKLFSPLTRQNRAHLIEFAHEMMTRTPARAVSGALRGLAARPDRTADLARLSIPTLVLVGEDDALTPPDEARKMADAIPGARLGSDPRRRAPLPPGKPRSLEPGDPRVSRQRRLPGRA